MNFPCKQLSTCRGGPKGVLLRDMIACVIIDIASDSGYNDDDLLGYESDLRLDSIYTKLFGGKALPVSKKRNHA